MKKIKKWVKSVRDVIINPKRFFTKIVADGNNEESMLKAFMYGLVGGILVILLNLFGGASMTIKSVLPQIIFVPVLAVAILFEGAGLMMLISEITDGERDWEIAIKGLASIFFVYPLILVLDALAFNCVSLWIISIVCDLYILFLVYNIAVYCMHGRRPAVLMVIGILGIFLLTVYLSDFHTGWLMVKNSSVAYSCTIP